MLTMPAQSKIRVPAEREAKATTARSLSFGSSMTRIWVTNSKRSIAAQINTNVSGLSATTASTPREVKTRVPIQFIALGKLLRTTAVSMIARHKVVRLIANAQAIRSPTNVGDWEKSRAGCQAGSGMGSIGKFTCQIKTLIHARKAPPDAINQLYR